VIEFESELGDELRASIKKNYPRKSMVLPDFSKNKRAAPSALIMGEWGYNVLIYSHYQQCS
jgi:hypothetical protein